MSSAWNWLGIFVWLIIIAYFLYIIHNTHSRKKKLIKVAMNDKKHNLASDISKNNFEITLFEVLILVIFLFGMGKTTYHHHIRANNSVVTAQYSPITSSQTKINKKYPNRKVHNYYVMINKSKARDFKQNMTFSVNGKKVRSKNSNSIMINNRNQLTSNPDVPYLVQKALHRKSIWKQLGNNQPGVVRLKTIYKNSAGNGIGLHANQKKFYYTIIKLPSKTKNGLYINNKKLKKRAKKAVPKG